MLYHVHTIFYSEEARSLREKCKYANLPTNAIVRLTRPRNGHSQDRETFLAPSADKETRNYDGECSSHHPSQSP